MPEDNTSRSSDVEGPSNNKCRLSMITVEPILFIIYFCNSLTDTFDTTVLLNRICLVTYKHTEKQCTGVIQDNIESELQMYLSKIILTRSIVECVLAATMSVLIAPWSDANGRKLFLILPPIGYCLSFVIKLIFSMFAIPPYFIIASSIPPSCVGGLIIANAVVYCYISDISTNKARVLRMMVSQLALPGGIILGNILSAKLTESLQGSSNLVIYSISIILNILIALYVYYWIPETIQRSEGHVGNKFFTLYHIKEMVKILLKPRRALGRLLFLFIVVIILLSAMVVQGESPFRFLVLKIVLKWNLSQYNYYGTITIISAVVIITIVMTVFKMFSVSTIYIVLLSSLSAFGSSIGLAFSKTSTGVYVSGVFGSLSYIVSAMAKTEVAKIFPLVDLGKAFTVLLVFESIGPLVASPIYSVVYYNTVAYRPQDLFYVSAACWLGIDFFSSLIILIQRYRGTNYLDI